MRPQWDAKAEKWDDGLPQSDLFAELLETIMEAVAPDRDEVALDLGAGTGFLAIPIAQRTRRTYAVDHSPAMLQKLAQHVCESGVHLWAAEMDLERSSLPSPWTSSFRTMPCIT